MKELESRTLDDMMSGSKQREQIACVAHHMATPDASTI
jgi:hypothetical protein